VFWWFFLGVFGVGGGWCGVGGFFGKLIRPVRGRRKKNLPSLPRGRTAYGAPRGGRHEGKRKPPVPRTIKS